jgi:cobyrinic acid a,c-diamide synthase
LGQVYSLCDSRGKALPAEGFRYKNTLASYVHIHFGSNPYIAEQFTAFVKGDRIE